MYTDRITIIYKNIYIYNNQQMIKDKTYDLNKYNVEANHYEIKSIMSIRQDIYLNLY